MATHKRRPDTDDLRYESLIARLAETVARLESSGLTLEEAMTAYEEGAALAAQCQTLLDTAEQRIEELRAAADEE